MMTSIRVHPHVTELDRRIELALERAVARATVRRSPSVLERAARYAVFPGGARIRPRLCLIAASANGDRHPLLASRAAAAVELLHCASLVHDDLPCFDNAASRRGKPSVHCLYGEPNALLVGDLLIVQSFAEVARDPRMVAVMARAARSLVAGQALEGEERVEVDSYHRAKTSSLFAASAALGALASGAEPAPWRGFGDAVGQAYQAADDLADAVGEEGSLGKPTGQDALFDRPSVVSIVGVEGTRRRLRTLLEMASARAPNDLARSFIDQLAALALSS